VSVLAVIPARGGSKGVPGKNLALVGGEELVARAVRIARAAATIDRVVVSTDSPEIAKVAAAAGAEVVARPSDLADDAAPTEAALLHALDTLGGPDPEYVVTLEPTTPLRTSDTIDACVRRAREIGADALITVAETRDVLGRLEAGVFEPLEPGQPRRRQLRAPLYREAGTVYLTRTAHLRATGSVLADTIYAVVVPEKQALDVNGPIDLVVARALAGDAE
jgi:CMP-N,N'-diacetyllegionaminic acid synthase